MGYLILECEYCKYWKPTVIYDRFTGKVVSNKIQGICQNVKSDKYRELTYYFRACEYIKRE